MSKLPGGTYFCPLLSLEYLDYAFEGDWDVYQRTRAFPLSEGQPVLLQGHYGQKHRRPARGSGLDLAHVHHLSRVFEHKRPGNCCLPTHPLRHNGVTHFIHESFWKEYASKYTRLGSPGPTLSSASSSSPWLRVTALLSNLRS